VRALVVLNGDPGGPVEWLASLAEKHDLVVAADGAAARLLEAGRAPDLVVGDLDSLAPRDRTDLERKGIAIEAHPAEKDRTDAELALDAAIARGADEITVAGAFGGARTDHAIGNLMLLAHPAYASLGLALVTERDAVTLLRGPGTIVLEGATGDLVTLVPLSERASGIRTAGLRYRLDGQDLVRGPSRGVSNELTAREASVTIDDGLLLVATHRR